MEIFIPILKADDTRHEIFGMMAEEAPDKSGEIFDYDSSKPYVKAWSDDAVAKTLTAGQEISYGNVRAQHNPKAVAGKLIDLQFDDKNKRIPIVAKITDPDEWRKVVEGVYTGFSIGGDYVKRWPDGAYMRYTARPKEVSIVDNQCAHGAKFTLIKSTGTEQRSFRTSDLSTLTAQIAALGKLVDARRASEFNANDLHGELQKSLANPLTKDEIEKKQAQSPRFVPREPGPCSSSDPWL
jgi:hypothetical protein